MDSKIGCCVPAALGAAYMSTYDEALFIAILLPNVFMREELSTFYMDESYRRRRAGQMNV